MGAIAIIIAAALISSLSVIASISAAIFAAVISAVIAAVIAAILAAVLTPSGTFSVLEPFDRMPHISEHGNLPFDRLWFLLDLRPVQSKLSLQPFGKLIFDHVVRVPGDPHEASDCN
jgi:hypothetical protein